MLEKEAKQEGSHSGGARCLPGTPAIALHPAAKGVLAVRSPSGTALPHELGPLRQFSFALLLSFFLFLVFIPSGKSGGLWMR